MLAAPALPLAQQAAVAGGRWSTLYRASILGRPLTQAETAADLARLLLGRHGVLTQAALEYEEGRFEWGPIYSQLKRMEMRGEVRRGYFVSGLPGAQFALPEAVEALRAAAGRQDETPVVVCAADPAWRIPGSEWRTERMPSTHGMLVNGRLVLAAVENGESLMARAGAHEDEVRGALRAYLGRPGAPKHLAVKKWDGAPVVGSAGDGILKELGFYGVPGGMERWGREA
jgi:ATP-dependent Lhr-like helicase